MQKLKALKTFGDEEGKYVSGAIAKGEEFFVNDEQARCLTAIGSAERAANQAVVAKVERGKAE
jgi:predicted ribosome-associated RNA-binding protein Tma20